MKHETRTFSGNKMIHFICGLVVFIVFKILLEWGLVELNMEILIMCLYMLGGCPFSERTVSLSWSAASYITDYAHLQLLHRFGTRTFY